MITQVPGHDDPRRLRRATLVALASAFALSVGACGGSSDDDTAQGNGALSGAALNSSHGLSGSLAIVSDGHILHGSVRQGRCEFTMVGFVGAHAIADQAEIYTGKGFFGKAVVDVSADDSVGFQAAILPAGCETVFNRSQVAAGTRFRTTANLNADVVDFRTIVTDKAFFRNGADLNVPGNSFVIRGQTVQIFTQNGAETPGFILARFTAPGASQSTVGFIPEADVSPAQPLHDAAFTNGDGDGDGDPSRTPEQSNVDDRCFVDFNHGAEACVKKAGNNDAVFNQCLAPVRTSLTACCAEGGSPHCTDT